LALYSSGDFESWPLLIDAAAIDEIGGLP